MPKQTNLQSKQHKIKESQRRNAFYLLPSKISLKTRTKVNRHLFEKLDRFVTRTEKNRPNFFRSKVEPKILRSNFIPSYRTSLQNPFEEKD